MNLIKIKNSTDNSPITAPEEIINLLKNLNLNENHLLPNPQIKEINLREDKNQNFETIIDKSKELFQNSEQNVFLGESHSMTLPLVKAFAQSFQNPGIIIFDAHPDCRNDLGQEDLLTGILKEKLIKKENIFLVGLRSWTSEEYQFLKDNNIRYFSMQEIAMEGIFEISESFMPPAKDFGALYISIDIDVLDPAFAPGTDYPEPGGLTTRELLFFLYRLKRLKNFKAADLVEINPKDKNTLLVGTKIVNELI